MRTSTNEQWKSLAAPALSVVILGFRRADLLARAIHSFRAHAGPYSWELVLVLNGASPEVQAYARALMAQANFPLCLSEVKAQRPGAARNAGVRAARADLLFFLDDDVECFQDIGAAAIDLFRDPRVVAAGGANLTPPGSGALERATGYVFSSHLGAAGMSARYRVLCAGQAGEHSLILCNLALRRGAFVGELGFATHLISAEENVLLQRLSSAGHQLWRSPALAVFHRRRENWRGLWEQSAKYGAGRAQHLLLLPQSWRAIYFLPSVWLAYWVALLAIFTAPLALVPGAIYFLLALAHALYFSIRHRDGAGLLALVIFPLVHAAYGWGFFRTLLDWAPKRRKLFEHAL